MLEEACADCGDGDQVADLVLTLERHRAEGGASCLRAAGPSASLRPYRQCVR